MIARASARRSPAQTAVERRGRLGRRGRRRTRATIVLTIPARPRRWPSSGEKIGDAARVQQRDLLGDDDAAAAAVDLDVAGAALAQQLDEVAEVLDVAALVGADRDALHVLLDGGGDDLVDASGRARGGSPRRPAPAGSGA